MKKIGKRWVDGSTLAYCELNFYEEQITENRSCVPMEDRYKYLDDQHNMLENLTSLQSSKLLEIVKAARKLYKRLSKHF